jgi:hypothetical protein
MGRDLRDLIAQTRERYNSIGHVYCPILNSPVYFTSEGLRHLTYKGNRKKRNVKEQEYKLLLFGLVIPVIKNAPSVERWRFIGRPDDPNNVQYYALVFDAGKKPISVRVIIKRTGDGQFNFHSVMRHSNKKRTSR